MSFKLDDWKPRQKLSAAHLQQAIEVIRRFARVAGIDIGEGGVPDPPPDTRWRFGRVVAEGPDAEPDYDDERYFVVEADIDAGIDITALIELTDRVPWESPDDGDDVPVIHTVTNLAEVLDHSHFLEEGRPVLFRFEYDQPIPPDPDDEDPVPESPNRRLIMDAAPIDFPQYVGMVRQGVAARTAGWDWTPSVHFT